MGLTFIGAVRLGAVRLHPVPPEAGPGRGVKIPDGGPAVPTHPQLRSPVVVLGDDGPPGAAYTHAHVHMQQNRTSSRLGKQQDETPQ